MIRKSWQVEFFDEDKRGNLKRTVMSNVDCLHLTYDDMCWARGETQMTAKPCRYRWCPCRADRKGNNQ